MKTKYSEGDLVEVKILNQWHPAYIESDMGGGWYMCNMGLRSDMFTAGNIRKAKRQLNPAYNQDMNNEQINEIVGRYLAANPETANRLAQAAIQYENERAAKAESMRRFMAAQDAVTELDQAIALATKAVNSLKGDILRLQKERKQALALRDQAKTALS